MRVDAGDAFGDLRIEEEAPKCVGRSCSSKGTSIASVAGSSQADSSCLIASCLGDDSPFRMVASVGNRLRASTYRSIECCNRSVDCFVFKSTN